MWFKGKESERYNLIFADMGRILSPLDEINKNLETQLAGSKFCKAKERIKEVIEDEKEKIKDEFVLIYLEKNYNTIEMYLESVIDMSESISIGMRDYTECQVSGLTWSKRGINKFYIIQNPYDAKDLMETVPLPRLNLEIKTLKLKGLPEPKLLLIDDLKEWREKYKEWFNNFTAKNLHLYCSTKYKHATTEFHDYVYPDGAPQ